MTDSRSHPSGPTRILVTAAMTAALVSGGSAAASAAGSGSGADSPSPPAQSSLQIQAQELAGQIQADGRNLDRLSESLDAAQLRSQKLDSQLGVVRRAMATTNARVGSARAALKEQALLSYLAGGAPLISSLPSHPGSDPNLTVSYAEIVSGGQRRAVAAYRGVLNDQARQSKQLTEARHQVAASVLELRADRAAASQALVSEQGTLAQVKGQLATLVAQVQVTQQRAEQAAVETSLAAQGELPAPAVASRPAIAIATAGSTGPSTRPTGPGSTTAAPARPGPGPTSAPLSPTTTRPRPAPPPPTTTPRTTPPTTAPPPPPPSGGAARGSATAVRYAYAQLGKPYQWAGAGPRSFDCSGLTMMAWASAGVYLPHLAQAQYDMTRRIPLGSALAGDLIFFGTPDNVYHVGIYIGGGQMIDAPSTGQDVSISSIYWANLLGAGRIID